MSILSRTESLRDAKVKLEYELYKSDFDDIDNAIKERVVAHLSNQFIALYGDKILKKVSKDSIAAQIEKRVSDKFWESKKND